MKDITLTNHYPPIILESDNRPLVNPIHVSVKYTFNKMSDIRDLFSRKRQGYFYSRFKNPTVDELERLLAQLQGVEAGIATASGVAAISSCLISLLQAGDQVVYFIESYKPTRYLIEKILKKFGVVGIKLSIDDHQGIEQAFANSKTKVCIFESPTNPQLKLADIPFISQKAQEHGVTTILDNTFAGFHKNRDCGIDYYIHSLTKFANGHGDAMGGIILGNQQRIEQIFIDTVELGPTLDPQAAALILRGMKTYSLRYERQVLNAVAVAKYLRDHPLIDELCYPDSQKPDGGTVICFNFKDKSTNMDRFIEGLEVFQLCASLGSTESLVAPVLFFYGGDLSSEEQRIAGIDSTSIRLSLGIEDISDLIADLQRALEHC